MKFDFLFLTYSFCIIGSRLIHFTRTNSNAKSSFLWQSNIPLDICTTASLFIHLLIDIWVASMP